MSKFRISSTVTDLVIKLFDEGYKGTASLSRGEFSVAKEYLKGGYAFALSGFCKEILHITEDEYGNIHFIGRYEGQFIDPSQATVESIVHTAWMTYLQYKGSGYDLPYEFKSLFEKYGYISEEEF